MRYISTRGQALALDFERAMMTGLASDGGLYVPEVVPVMNPEEIAALAGLPFEEAAYRIMRPFVGDSSQQIADAWKPWIDTTIELFGARRCLFESNFPVDKLSTGYATLWNAFKRLAAGASPEEKTALFSGTASRVYRIGA